MNAVESVTHDGRVEGVQTFHQWVNGSVNDWSAARSAGRSNEEV